MTRPGEPAEPPGPSAGDRMVREWVRDRMLGRPDGMLSPESHVDNVDTADLARRIDAALAEVARERDLWREDASVRELNTRDANRALAERGAQIVALREALSSSLEQLRRHADTDAGLYDWQRVLTSTADAAARCLERTRQEGAEEMREQIAREVGALISQGVTSAFLADAIRATAARRG